MRARESLGWLLKLGACVTCVACGGGSKSTAPEHPSSTMAIASAVASSSVSAHAATTAASSTLAKDACTTAADVGALSWSSDARRFAAAYGTWVRIYASSDLGSWKEQRTLTLGPARVSKLAFSPDGHTIVVGSSDGSVRIFDAETGASSARIEGHTGELRIVRFRPDGKSVLTADASSARISSSDGKLVVELDLPAVDAGAPRASAAAFSDDGQMLAVATPTHIGLFDSTWREKKKLADAGASFVAFTPGAAFVIAAGPPRWLRLWDLKTSKIATSYLSTVAKGVGTANGAAPPGTDKPYVGAGISHAAIDAKQGWLSYMEVGSDPIARRRLQIFATLPLGLLHTAIIVSPDVPSRVVLGPRDNLALGAGSGTDVSIVRIEGSKLRALQTIARGNDPCAVAAP